VRILIIEDDPDIAQGVATALRREGHHPEVAATGPEGENLALMNSYGAILLDLMLPGRPGDEVCRRLRQADVRTPILMMTARDAVPDRVSGLDAGADDYIVKPFAVDELLARLRAVTRRENQRKRDVIYVGGITVDVAAKTVTVDEKPVHLTAREFDLLATMARNPGRVYTREFILENVWNNDEALPNTVSFHMSSLRKKVDPGGRYIRTVHGLGYVLESP
jgi:two-component system, OmpR family, copper resistance phosphate regulon response regulator CusR